MADGRSDKRLRPSVFLCSPPPEVLFSISCCYFLNLFVKIFIYILKNLIAFKSKNIDDD